MRNLTRDVLAVLLGALSVVALVLGSLWVKELRPATKRGGQEPAEPFRIAGNFYYVGANDLSAFLITAPEGHVVLDGGYPTTAPMIMESIATLGFDIKDVKVLLNSAPYADHAGGLAALQQASGAKLWASEASAGSSPPAATTPTSPCRCGSSSGPGFSATRRRASITASRTATRSASGRSRSPRMSRPATRAAAPRGRSPSATATAC